MSPAQSRMAILTQERAQHGVQLWQALRQIEDLERTRKILFDRLREIDAELNGLRQAAPSPDA